MITPNQYQSMSQTELDSELLNACDKGDLKLVSYLLASPELNLHANIHYREQMALFCAINNEHFDVFKYLLSSPELKEHADIHFKNDQALSLCCYLGYSDWIKFLLSAPKLKEHANFFAEKAHFFKLYCENLDSKTLNYLIFDYKIPQTEDITFYLNAYPTWHFAIQAKEMFKARDLHLDLENSLNIQNNNNDKKIKI